MAFFNIKHFLCSFCMIANAAIFANNTLTYPDEPDRKLAKMILERPKDTIWKIWLLYGHGAPVARNNAASLPENWKKEDHNAPYFLPGNTTFSDEALYRFVRTASSHFSIPAMRIQAFMLWHGRGVKRNPAYAVKLWQLAAKNGDETAAGLLAGLPGSPEQKKYSMRFQSLKKSRLKLNIGNKLYIPQLLFQPQDTAMMISLRENESVHAFLNRAINIWKDGGQACILLSVQD